MSYLRQHKYHLFAFIILIIVAGVSGYFVFTTHDTLNTTPDKIQNTDNNIQITKEETASTLSSTQGEEDDEVNSKKTNTQNTTKTTTTIKDSKVTSTEPEILNPITLEVTGEEYTIELKEGTTVYELMQTLSASSVKPFMFSGKDYGAGMGYFVTEINGVKNDPQTGKYWIYYVNGESAKVGISNYIINKGDVIEWKYENTF